MLSFGEGLRSWSVVREDIWRPEANRPALLRCPPLRGVHTREEPIRAAGRAVDLATCADHKDAKPRPGSGSGASIDDERAGGTTGQTRP